jgi:hypothetical protein
MKTSQNLQQYSIENITAWSNEPAHDLGTACEPRQVRRPPVNTQRTYNICYCLYIHKIEARKLQTSLSSSSNLLHNGAPIHIRQTDATTRADRQTDRQTDRLRTNS